MKVIVEQAYLNDLKQSIQITDPLVLKTEMNFTKSKYTGQETIAEILQEYGIDLGDELLTEGLFSTPINKLKGMVSSLGKDIGDMEGLKRIKKKFGSMASRVSTGTLEKKAVQMGAAKDVDEKEIQSAFSIITRALSAYSSALAAVTTPLGWLVLLVALIKSGDLPTFKKNFKEAISELGKAIKNTGTEYEKAISMFSEAYKMLFICLIPPWIQALVFMPVAGILAFIAYILMAIAFLDHFGD